MSKKNIAVIGGGAAGLMAAGQAAEAGANVIILEKMKRPGRKICISGKGRCNITNSASLPDFISRFGKNGRFLHQPFSRFFSSDLVKFFEEKGLAISLERGGRYFPTSGNAPDILKILLQWLKDLKVEIRPNCRVTGLITEKHRIVGVKTASEIISCDAVILTTGGSSYPMTGSTGDGYLIAEEAGHSIIHLRPALVPLTVEGDLSKRLEGLELRNIEVKLFIDGKQKQKHFGELHFLKNCISGPVILTMSGTVVDSLLAGRKVHLNLDLKPALDEKKLDNRLIRDFSRRNKETLTEILRGLMLAPLVPLCIEQTAIDGQKTGGLVNRKERKRLLKWLKNIRIEITGHRPLSEAIVTAGGINLREVEPSSMESKIISGLYLAGEILDLNGNTGGYNLQAAFSTGWLAGSNAASTDTLHI